MALGTRLVTAAEMRALDAQTIQTLGVPGVALMESAGRGVVELIAERSPIDGVPICVVCGPGNNGGDGFVVARHLFHRGAEVSVVLVAAEARVQGDARVHLEAARRSGVPILDGTEAAFADAAARIDGARVIVDALLGTGTARPVEGHLRAVIERMNAAAGMRVAVDLPSGLDADRGVPLGACVQAHHTVTFAFAKLGLVSSPGFVHAGALRVVDIGIPEAIAGPLTRTLLDERCLAPLRTPRAPTSHKGTNGHALIVAGSRGRTGAALLAGEACARAGAGLVTVASPDDAQAALQARVVEVMTAPLGPEAIGDGADTWARLEPLLDGKRAVAFGPGVPRGEGSRALLARLVGACRGALVIDADGLNLLAKDLSPLEWTTAKIVLTPHPTEMARLAGLKTDAVQEDRANVAAAFSRQHGAVVVLKGARTVIAAPDGRLAVNPTGNPGLGSGGTGDVLTGVITALLAQGLPPFEAACAGAYLHGRAADRVAAERGEVGMLARDVIEALPAARR